MKNKYEKNKKVNNLHASKLGCSNGSILSNNPSSTKV